MKIQVFYRTFIKGFQNCLKTSPTIVFVQKVQYKIVHIVTYLFTSNFFLEKIILNIQNNRNEIILSKSWDLMFFTPSDRIKWLISHYSLPNLFAIPEEILSKKTSLIIFFIKICLHKNFNKISNVGKIFANSGWTLKRKLVNIRFQIKLSSNLRLFSTYWRKISFVQKFFQHR